MYQEIFTFIPNMFYQVLYMTVIGSIIGLIILFIRNIFDKKLSGKLRCFMWLIVLVALLIPIRFEITTKISDNKILNQMREIKNDSEIVFMSRIENIKDISNVEKNNTESNLENSMSLQKIDDKNIEASTENDQINFKEITVNIIIPYAWAVGLISFLILFIHGSLRIKRRVSKNVYKDERIENILNNCQKQLNIKEKIKIILQDYKKVPSIFGVINPGILITEELLKEDDEVLKYIFLHELSHYKRKDIILNHVLLLILAIHWFNPVVWFLFNKIRQDIEIGADELATNKLSKNECKEYGMVLINLLRNSSKENYTANLLCMSDTGKNMERRILMIKGKAKTTVISLIIIIIAIGIIAGVVFVKFEDEKAFSSMEKIGNSSAGEGIIEEVSEEEIEKIEEYINKICNDYFSLGRISRFDNINDADKNWIYGHLKADEDSYLTKEEIESNLKKLFGNNLKLDLEKDKKALEYNNIVYNSENSEYEFLPYGTDTKNYYTINAIYKNPNGYIANVIEYAVTSDLMEKYVDEGDFAIIYAYDRYDDSEPLMNSGKEVFHLEYSKIDSVRPSKVLNNEVLKRKQEFLAYDIVLEKTENNNFIAKEVKEADAYVIEEDEAKKESNVIQKAEFETRALFELPGTHVTTYETDLMANDMTYNSEVKLYHKIITTKEDYDKYDERLDLPDVDLTQNFVVIIANENLRDDDETDLTIDRIDSEEDYMHIIMKQKENPTFYSSGVNRPGNGYISSNNVFWAVVSLSELRENADVEIEK